MNPLSYLSYSLIFLLGASMVSSCTESKASTVQDPRLPALPPLKKEELFNQDLVYDYLFENEDRNTDSLQSKSKASFLKALDLFRNQKKPAESLPLFMESLAIYPAAKTYNELGDAYFAQHNFDKAIEAYSMAIRLNYQPLGETYFNMACIQAARDGDVGSVLSLAMRNGFRDSARFVSEPYLDKFRSSTTYQNLFLNYIIADHNSGRNPHFQTFLFSFPKLGTTFAIEESEVGSYRYEDELSYEYSDFIEEMENVSFGRDVSNIFVGVGTLAETPEYTLLLYKSVDMYASYPPVYTMMATFNSKTGEQIDKKVFACNCSAESVKTGKFANGVITVEEKKRIWEKSPTEVSISDNKIKEYQAVSTSQYSVQKDGKIEALPVSAKN